jgi:hypothetical protein
MDADALPDFHAYDLGQPSRTESSARTIQTMNFPF